MRYFKRDPSTAQKLNRWLIAIVILAALLRMVAIGRESLWFDEAISYLTADLSLGQILNNTIKDPHPPLYYLLLHFWLKAFAQNDAALRLFGVMWDLLLIPVVFVLGQMLLEQKRLALVPALLVAISPFHIFYSHELRMYTMLMFLASLTVLTYLVARARMVWRWWLLFIFVALLSIYTHLFAFFVLLALGLHALINYRQRQALHRTVLSGLILVILFLPWIALLANESQYNLGSLRPLAQARPDESSLAKLFTSTTFLLFGFSTSIWYNALALFLIVASLAFFLLELRKIRRRGMNIPALPLLIVGCVFGVPTTVHALRPFFLPERTMAAASPFLLILLGWFSAQKKSLLPYLVIVIGAVMFVGTVLYLQSKPLKPPYRDAVRFVEAQRLVEDVVVHSSDGSYLPALRYANFPQHSLLAGDPDFRKPRTVYEAYGGEIWERSDIEEKGQRLWLVVAREHSIAWQEEQIDYFSNHYLELETHLFGGIEVKLYQLTPGSIGSN